MKAKLDYYRIFYETARYASFSTAAKNLYVSQSAISQCIHQLEKELDTQLFVRSRKGVALTNEGKLLFQKVENAMQALEQGETLLARLHHLDSGTLVIAAADTLTTHFLLPYIERFHAEYSGIRIEMLNSYSSRNLQSVKDGKAEIAFVNLPASDPELHIEPCLEIHDIFVCGSKYAAKNKYSWKDISEEPLILLETNSNSRRFLNENFSQKGIELTPQIEFAAHDLLIRFASIQMGVSCVIEEFAKEELKKGSICKMNLIPPLPSRHIGYAHLDNYPLSLPAEIFLQMIRQK